MPVYAAVYRHQLAENWILIAISSAGCLVGTVLGKRLLATVPQAAFRRIVCGVLVAVALFVLARFVLSA